MNYDRSMIAGTPLSWWIAFHCFVGVLLFVDLVVLQRLHHVLPRWLSAAWTVILVVLAAGFTLLLAHLLGRQSALEFASGYLIESSLSVDNLFVFLMMFRALGLDHNDQRRVLLWGVLGAIVMRAIFIATGVSLLARFEWIQYVFGAFLLFASVRLLSHSPGTEKPSRSLQWFQRKILSRTSPADAGSSHQALRGPAFLLVIAAVEITDLIFALDSIPAVLAITRHPFLVYTSNIFAILGLRSLFFVLSGLLDRMRLLHYGLGAILAFVAVKMLTTHWFTVPVGVSLAVILVILAICVVGSLIQNKRHPLPKAST